MITDTDIEQVESIKKILNEKLNHRFDWEIANKIECLDRIVKNLRIAPDSFKFCPVESKFYTAECGKCGWWGSSELLEGGGQIADTGDYGDCYCPVCGNSDLDDKSDDTGLTSSVKFSLSPVEIKNAALKDYQKQTNYNDGYDRQKGFIEGVKWCISVYNTHTKQK